MNATSPDNPQPAGASQPPGPVPLPYATRPPLSLWALLAGAALPYGYAAAALVGHRPDHAASVGFRGILRMRWPGHSRHWLFSDSCLAYRPPSQAERVWRGGHHGAGGRSGAGSDRHGIFLQAWRLSDGKSTVSAGSGAQRKLLSSAASGRSTCPPSRLSIHSPTLSEFLDPFFQRRPEHEFCAGRPSEGD